MCGIVGMVAQQPVNQTIYDALTILQHRGQDAAGILTSDRDRVHLRKSNGLVRDVLRQEHMLELTGNMGIGHVRYPTAGSDSVTESQPFYVNSPYGLGIVHNGNLVNTAALTQDLVERDLRHLNTPSDSEVLLNVFAFELQRVGRDPLTPQALFQAMAAVYARVQGAFSAIVMIHGYGMVAFRDPQGIRPIVFGQRDNEHGREYMVASESIALNAFDFTDIEDLAPGEAVFIGTDGSAHRQQCVRSFTHTPCIFEYIYLARPDSIIDGIPVYQTRLGMGRKLGERILQEWPDHDIDVVIPIPDTSRTAALPIALQLNVNYREGFVKNRYIGRTFIMPNQSERRSSVRLKLNAIREEFAGKNVLLVDDSIVRGTTSKEIIQMARDAGAKKVYFASAAPEVRYPNVYGIDMPTANELIAHERTVEDISKLIGADRLIYQTLEDVYAAVNEAAERKGVHFERFEDSVFTGRYPTDGINDEYLKQLSNARNDLKRQKKTKQHRDGRI